MAELAGPLQACSAAVATVGASRQLAHLNQLRLGSRSTITTPEELIGHMGKRVMQSQRMILNCESVT